MADGLDWMRFCVFCNVRLVGRIAKRGQRTSNAYKTHIFEGTVFLVTSVSFFSRKQGSILVFGDCPTLILVTCNFAILGTLIVETTRLYGYLCRQSTVVRIKGKLTF